MYNEKVINYSKDSKYNYEMENYTIKYEWNSRTCWTNLVVYLKIEDDKIIDWSYTWELTIIAKSCANMFWEYFIGKHFDDIMILNEIYIYDKADITLSWRKKEACLSALLATQKAINTYIHWWDEGCF